MTLSTERVRVDLEDRIATVTLDDPERRNALDVPFALEIDAVFRQLEEHDCGAVVVTGAPPAFCAGADLSHLSGSAEQGLRDLYRGFVRVLESPLPTIAAVNGAAVGAGVNMALCCDVILCGTSATIDTRFTSLGLHPGGGHTFLLRRLAGPQVAKAMSLFGDVITGEEAARVGFAYRCVPDDELLEAARHMCRHVVDANPELVSRIKSTIDEMVGFHDHEEALRHELGHQVWSLSTTEFQDRLAKLQSKISSR